MTEAEERDAFYQAIMDNWDDDTPRLVYADWLDERGDEPSAWRASFIRGQIEDSKPQNSGKPQKKRRREILATAALFRRWTEQCQLPVKKIDFERGFLRKLALSLRTYTNAGPGAWLELGPIEHVTLSPSLEQSWYYHNIAELANHSGLLTWRSLTFDPPHYQAPAFPNAGIDSLLRSAHLRGLKFLQVAWSPESTAGDEPSHAIAANSAYASLAELFLWDGCRTDGGLIALASAPHLRNLQELSLQGQFTREGLKCLAHSELLATVVHLEIVGNVQPGSITSLLASPHLGSLRDLSLNGNIAELVALPTYCNLDCVHLRLQEWSPAAEADLLALAKRLTSHTIVRVGLARQAAASLDEATEQRLRNAYRGRLFFDT